MPRRALHDRRGARHLHRALEARARPERPRTSTGRTIRCRPRLGHPLTRRTRISETSAPDAYAVDLILDSTNATEITEYNDFTDFQNELFEYDTEEEFDGGKDLGLSVGGGGVCLPVCLYLRQKDF